MSEEDVEDADRDPFATETDPPSILKQLLSSVLLPSEQRTLTSFPQTFTLRPYNIPSYHFRRPTLSLQH